MERQLHAEFFSACGGDWEDVLGSLSEYDPFWRIRNEQAWLDPAMQLFVRAIEPSAFERVLTLKTENMRVFITIILSLFVLIGTAQDPYFPPTTGTTWETVDPSALGWCADQIPPLLQYLDSNNTKAFIVLKDGRIAIEHYFDTFTQDSVWYWASAGKSLTSFLVGLAQQDGSLDINQPSSNYLGAGWTSCTPAQEQAITVRHQLTMTTGLDDTTGDADCTDPACLHYLADAGTRWAYFNAPYTLLDGVIENATGSTMNSFVFSRLTQPAGISGAYVQVGYNNIFFSKPRSMARFGLLMLNQGTWNTTPIMTDMNYFTDMTTPSQTINNSYGYLWWLNGQTSYHLPGSQIEFPGMLMPNEPADGYNALGKNGQFINVIPSEGIVLVRMGNAPDGYPVPYLLNDEIWARLNAVICVSTAVEPNTRPEELTLYPNPAQDLLHITLPSNYLLGDVQIMDALGSALINQQVLSVATTIDLKDLSPGCYQCVVTTPQGRVVRGFVKE